MQDTLLYFSNYVVTNSLKAVKQQINVNFDSTEGFRSCSPSCLLAYHDAGDSEVIHILTSSSLCKFLFFGNSLLFINQSLAAWFDVNSVSSEQLPT